MSAAAQTQQTLVLDETVADLAPRRMNALARACTSIADDEQVLAVEAPSGPALIGAWRIEIVVFFTAMALLGASAVLPAPAAAVAGGLIALSVASALVKLTRWNRMLYLVTTDRVILARGTLVRTYTTIPLHQIRRVRLVTRGAARVLGYGTVEIIVGTRPQRVHITRVRRPRRFVELVQDAAELATHT